MDQIIALVQEKIPGFGHEILRFDDFLAACDVDGIGVEIRAFGRDEQLRRDQRRIVLNAGLAGSYRTFVGFHALAHWYAHPGQQDFYLGSPGWLDTIELEASTIGFLAIAPPREPGPPWPRLTRARCLPNQLELYAAYPNELIVDPRAGTIRRGWRDYRRRPTILFRRAQLELPLGQAELPFPLGRRR